MSDRLRRVEAKLGYLNAQCLSQKQITRIIEKRFNAILRKKTGLKGKLATVRMKNV